MCFHGYNGMFIRFLHNCTTQRSWLQNNPISNYLFWFFSSLAASSLPHEDNDKTTTSATQTKTHTQKHKHAHVQGQTLKMLFKMFLKKKKNELAYLNTVKCKQIRADAQTKCMHNKHQNPNNYNITPSSSKKNVKWAKFPQYLWRKKRRGGVSFFSSLLLDKQCLTY